MIIFDNLNEVFIVVYEYIGIIGRGFCRLSVFIGGWIGVVWVGVFRRK